MDVLPQAVMAASHHQALIIGNTHLLNSTSRELVYYLNLVNGILSMTDGGWRVAEPLAISTSQGIAHILLCYACNEGLFVQPWLHYIALMVGCGCIVSDKSIKRCSYEYRRAHDRPIGGDL